ncbi:TIGR02680 family protein [Nocardia amamiensis]|uniref:TIGR02680 family protein n=1 Tax=Nocardia amamiensis TaxID=404578 RepID=UPI00082C9477|nr:TIGR02680 family protein [Nocardia amamiensis]
MKQALPQSRSSRWQPLRAGLVDLFYYDVQEFWFRDGRLLLRGNNGTGKSKVLALMLPFLLDADLSAHRVEPDADPKKRMEWNLLLGGAHQHPERIGYSWLEFGRVDDDGVEHFCTIGCGMKAVTGRGIAGHWFFVTSARVGAELWLVDGQGFPLTRDRLAEALDERGERYDTARDYRRAVDEALFGLGEQRYGALVDLLIQLRQPQLSKRPSEKVLSQALTESLPPLDQAILADVAEAFRSLQEDRDELNDMREALTGTRGFLAHYRAYARIASRRKAAVLRQAHSRYERVSKDLNEARTALAAAEQREGELRSELTEVGDEEIRLLEHRQALQDSEAMDARRDLGNAREFAERAERLAEQRESERVDAVQVAADRETKYVDAHDAAENARHEVTGRRADADSAAGRALVGGPHGREVVARLDESAPVDVLRRAAGSVVDAQRAAVKHIRGLVDKVDALRAELSSARGKIDEFDSQAAELAGQRHAAEQAVAAAAQRLVDATARHLRQTTELRLDDLDGVLDELSEWTQLLGGDNPAAVAVRACAEALTDRLSRADAAAEADEKRRRATLTELTDELERLEQGGIEAPPSRYTRDAAARVDRDGAPLWQVVDFAGGLAESDRAGIEAAVEAAGILDAWVTPDGELHARSGDVIVTSTGYASGASLADVMVPAINDSDSHARAVTPEAVRKVLRNIGFGPESTHHTWVDASGRFRIGVLDGAWHKPAAQYLGAGAREQARQHRMSEIRGEIGIVTAALEQIADERRALADRRRVARAEQAGLPGDAELRTAHRHVDALADQQRQLTERRTVAVDAADRLAEHHAVAEADRDRDAADCGLPVDRESLERITEALTDYRVTLEKLWSAVVVVRGAEQREEETKTDFADAVQRRERAIERAETERREAIGAQSRFDTLNENVGAAVAELDAKLAQVAAGLRDNKRRGAELGRDLEQTLLESGRAEGKRDELTAQLEQERQQRDTAAAALQRFATTRLLDIALEHTAIPDAGEPWAPNPAVVFARAVDAELADVVDDDKSLERAQRRVTDEHKNLGDLLSRQGNSTTASLLEDGIVVEVVFCGKLTTVAALAATLDAEVADRGRLLTEREREILENHLVSEVACALQELILAAERQVAQMNAELDARPTSTGMKLRLAWVPGDDAPAGAASALRQLRRTADVWNDADRAAVGEFLQREIERVRSADVAGTWLDHLTRALDYRQWNKFVIELQQRGQWRSATGPASGGERVLAASVPLFAAASAHYASAGNPHAPRLVMLDEAFAGVDDNARAKYLGLLAAFDLDVVMTSEREWGCYPEVPGLAIAQLARTDDVAAVLVTNWEWDGRERRRVEQPAPTLVPVRDEQPVAGKDGLWE